MNKTIEFLKGYYEEEVIDGAVDILTKLNDNEEEVELMLKESFKYDELVSIEGMVKSYE